MQIVMKVLSGAHLGAEAPIEEGEQVIGQSTDCAIVLTDHLLAPHHLQIKREADALFLEPLEGDVFLSGKLLARNKPHKVESFQVFTFGSTHGVLGAADAKWPAINLPSLTHFATRSPLPPKNPHEGLHQPPRLLPGFALAGICAVLFVLQVAHLFPPEAAAKIPESVTKSRTLSTSTISKTRTSQEQLKAVIQTLPFAHRLLVRQGYNKKSILHGYLATNAQRKELLALLQREKLQPILSIYVQEQIRADILATLVARGESLQVTTKAPGEFLLKGHPKTSKEALEQMLLGEIPGLLQVSLQVPTSSQKASYPGPVLQIRGVSLGVIPFVTLADGNRYMEGGRLQDGYVLKKILADHLVFARRGQEFVYPYTSQ